MDPSANAINVPFERGLLISQSYFLVLSITTNSRISMRTGAEVYLSRLVVVLAAYDCFFIFHFIISLPNFPALPGRGQVCL